MKITSTASSAFQRIALDLVGPIQPDVEDNKYVLTIQCDLSKFVEFYVLQNKETEAVARAIVEKLSSLHI